MGRLPKGSPGDSIDDRIRQFKQREREFDELMAEARDARARKAKVQPKTRKRPIKPGTRDEWSVRVLRERIKEGDENPQGTLLRRYKEKYGLGQTKLATIQQRFLRLLRRVEKELADK